MRREQRKTLERRRSMSGEARVYLSVRFLLTTLFVHTITMIVFAIVILSWIMVLHREVSLLREEVSLHQLLKLRETEEKQIQ